jgi:hypothetical protein
MKSLFVVLVLVALVMADEEKRFLFGNEVSFSVVFLSFDQL